MPRSSLTDAPESHIYRSKGWHPPRKKKVLKDEFEEGILFARKNGTKEGIAILEELNWQYINRHLDDIDLQSFP